jgi:signal transduction histidine kinase
LEAHKRRRGLWAQLSVTIVLVVLFTVALISLLSNVLIARRFEAYVLEQEKQEADNIVSNLSRQYDSLTQSWNTAYIHGLGMYALYDGYIIKVYDRDGACVWDAENHDMSLCMQIMDEISTRMEDRRPNAGGRFISKDYALSTSGDAIGAVSVSYYGPYFLNSADFHFLDTLNAVFISIGVFSLALSFIIGWFLARRISRPITKTVYIAKQIADGNYGIRFEGATRTREMDDLAASVNHLAGALSQQEDLRKRLTSDVAHELRTPLSILSSHLEAMIEGIWTPTVKRLESCREETGRLDKLVADLERLAKVESENLTLNKTPVDLLELLRTVSGHFALEAQKRNLALDVDGESTVVPADHDRICQVVTNLLSNAIKYTPENGHIRLTSKDTPDSGVIFVEDDGTGIPEEELPFIFERFYRADKSRSRKTGGAGIGLAIVRSIVKAHGGSVSAESQSEKGSCFSVVLPKRLRSS